MRVEFCGIAPADILFGVCNPHKHILRREESCKTARRRRGVIKYVTEPSAFHVRPGYVSDIFK